MTHAEFQEEWENQAEAELHEYLQRPIADLLRDAQEGRHGNHYMLWRAIAAQASLDEAAQTLLNVLRAKRLYWPDEIADHDTYKIRTNRRGEEYLARYHCAQALLGLLGASEVGYEAVDLAAERLRRRAKIERVAALIEKKLGTAAR